MAKKAILPDNYADKARELRDALKAVENDGDAAQRDERIEALINDHIAANIPDGVRVQRFALNRGGRIIISIENRKPF
jgi:hypothetical protein